MEVARPMRRVRAHLPRTDPDGVVQPDPSPGADHGRFLLACGVAAATLALFLVVLLVIPAEATARAGVIHLVLLALAASVLISCWRTARRAPGYNRRVWLLFTAAGLCWTVGQGFSFGYRPATAAPGPPTGSIVGLLAIVPTTAALFSIPPQHHGRSERLRVWVGVGIVLASVLLFCRSLVVALPQPTLLATGPAFLLTALYPACYVVLATLVWIVLLRVGTKGRMPLFFVTSGLIVYAWANVYDSFHGTQGRGYAGAVLSFATAWCYVMFILAAVSPYAADPRRPAAKLSRGRYIGLHSFVVYIPVMTSTITVNVLPRTFDPTIAISGLLVLVLFGVRQMLFSMDNSRLHDDLEGRLEDLVQRSAELRRLGLQNERIVQSVVDGVIGVDASGVITFANPAAAAMLGYSRADLMGVQEHDIFHGRPGSEVDPVDDCCVVRTAMGTGTAAVSAAESFLAADGHVFPVELAVGPITEGDVITGAVVVFRDVSERRKIEKMKNEFVSVVSHELRTPLTSIRGSLGLLAGGAGGLLTPKADRMVTVALESSERLTRLINDMLDIERIESGTMPVQLSDCRPRALIEQAVDSVRGLAGNHRLAVRADPALSPVRADADRIVQTLTNLIGNAVKFSPSLTTIEISAVQHDGRVDFAVADQGRGIPVDKLSRIFERFEQVDSSDSREKGGTGLGLAISQTIVQRHGSDLTVTSQLGVGSTFRFSLPAVEQARHQDPAPAIAPVEPELVGLPRILPDVKTQRLAR